MNFILDKDSFDINNIHFSEIKHNIIINGNFSKLFYSTSNFILKNIFIDFEIIPKELRKINVSYNKYYNDNQRYDSNSKFFVNFDLNDNNEVLQKIIEIEKNILDYYLKYRCIKKIPEYILKNQIINKNFKFYKNSCSAENSNKFYIKISGIWENNMQIGITYKIFNY